MDTFEQQELRARQALDMGAVFKAAFAVGLIFFVMSGGSPWTTAGTMNMIMGRDFVAKFWTLLIGHFAVSLLYCWIIGSVIYRLATPAAVAVGVGMGIGLYFANLVAFWSLGGKMQSPEFVTFFVHVTFSLFASLMYKAFSIPKVVRD